MGFFPFLTRSILLFSSAWLLMIPADAVLYSLTETFDGTNIYDNFGFVTNDPSGGWASYQGRTDAVNKGLFSTYGSQIHMAVDSTTVLDPAGPGRASVRIESNASFNKGLFIADFAHMPGAICGTWPAFWMYGPDWPNNGEIDIIEGVNAQSTNRMTGHTSAGCTIAGTGIVGQILDNNCNDGSAGCSIISLNPWGYGDGFNFGGGGIYAVQWTGDWISIWFWGRGWIPANVLNDQPNPATWGNPVAKFQGSCDIDAHFANMTIVLNTDFCGAWASGSAWTSPPCGSLAPTCVEYVAANPAAFSGAYWQVNSIKVFQPPPGAVPGLVKTNIQSTATPAASLQSLAQVPDAMGATATPNFGA